MERIFVNECGVFVPGADAAQREDSFRGTVESVDGCRRDAECSQQFAHRFALGNFTRFQAVVIGYDTVYDVLRSVVRFVFRSARGARDARPQQGTKQNVRTFHSREQNYAKNRGNRQIFRFFVLAVRNLSLFVLIFR